MKTVWKKGLLEDAQKEIELQFKASVVLRRRLVELLKEKYETEDKKRILKDAYDSPNWAYKQADTAGYHRALKEILSILEEDL